MAAFCSFVLSYVKLTFAKHVFRRYLLKAFSTVPGSRDPEVKISGIPGLAKCSGIAIPKYNALDMEIQTNMTLAVKTFSPAVAAAAAAVGKHAQF